MMTKTLEELRADQKAANRAIGRLEAKRRYEDNAALLGKTFKYRNCYSCPERPSDYWPLYAKVTKVDKDGYLKVFTFETDKYGHINIRVDDHKYHMSDGYQPISATEYRKALAALKARVGKF
jgi:hypothetical protein